MTGTTRSSQDTEQPDSSERFYLEGLDRYRPGDAFPNVGYVRRMRALLQADGVRQRP